MKKTRWINKMTAASAEVSQDLAPWTLARRPTPTTPITRVA